jgi:hypothetical protein
MVDGGGNGLGHGGVVLIGAFNGVVLSTGGDNGLGGGELLPRSQA